MTTQNRLLDDVSRLMTNAMGVAQGARNEAETAFKGWIDRWLAERDFVTREEFEAVREMAVKARTEAAELRARLDRLDPAGAAPVVTPTSAAAAPVVATAPAPAPGHAAAPASAAPVAPGFATAPGAGTAPTSAVEAPASAMTTDSDALPPQG